MKLYNTMSRSIQAFKPREPGKVKIFTCGPSTYRRPHIGNYRTFLYEDVLVRYLKYTGFEVQRVINFTDVEDKAIVEAEFKGQKVEKITSDVAKHFFRETDLLGILLPDEIPRSSTSVDQAVEIIQELVKKGTAYWHEGDVYFDPLKFKNFGKLFGLDMSKWPKHKVRFKKDTYIGKRWNRGDFILWHGQAHQTDSSAYWDTKIGRGRPAWNIQDPAMILQQIGTQVDINC
ncbi:MAG: class I tRNA ligase family protein, partial [Spirochaetales bacterium]|nr:class I tRNA ligase family protein [Spirochaetales bacterium]